MGSDRPPAYRSQSHHRARSRGSRCICVAYAAWLDAVATLQNFGAIMKSPNGHPIQSPAVSIANQQADLMLRIAIQYGFTPASRLRFPKSSTEKSWSDDLMSLEEIGAGLKTLEL
jgi:P27 family predicted phage terminase small subunit